jgi:drug/metabolite transporter (DMT)-like permease
MEKITFYQFSSILSYALVMGATQILLSEASYEISNRSIEDGILYACIFSIKLWIGLIIYAFAFVAWLIILNKIDIRIAYPIAMTSVIFAAIFQSIIKQSFPNFYYWIGLILVFVGVFFVHKSQI